jgi:hypothetical protein
MDFKEFMEISVLLGYYKNLLSDKQKEYMIQHFEEDMSLSEIAKEFDVSRQAVYDNIRRGIKILKDYEDKLSLYERDKKLIDELKKLRKNLSEEKLDEIIANLEI